MELVKDIHRLDRLGVWLVYSTCGGDSFHPKSSSSLLVEVRECQHLDPVLMELRESVLVKMNDSFTFGDDDILTYLERLYVQDVDDLRTRIIAEAYGSRYSRNPGSTKIYHDIK